jgi:tetratricopeptide (TPR) repeat protein
MTNMQQTNQWISKIVGKLPALLIISILSLGVNGCQTTQESTIEQKRAKILQSRKDLVRNSIDTGTPHIALRDLRILLQKYPNDLELHTLMGFAQLALKNHTRAVRHLRFAFKKDSSIKNGVNLSSALIANGESERAIKLLRSLLKRNDLVPYTYQERLYHNLGYANYKMNRFTTAETWYKKALVENPTFYQSHVELARIYKQTKRPAMARKSYRQAIDYCHVCFEPVENLSNLYFRIGQPNEARKVLLSFTRIDGITPTDKTKAHKLLKWAEKESNRTRRIGRGSPRNSSKRG